MATVMLRETEISSWYLTDQTLPQFQQISSVETRQYLYQQEPLGWGISLESLWEDFGYWNMLGQYLEM